MSTRANIIFKERKNTNSGFIIYQHYDGYPTSTIPDIIKSLQKAWKLPRYEPDEFACAFIAANKQNPGGYRLEGTWKEGDGHNFDIEWVYHVFFDEERKQLCIGFNGRDEKTYYVWVDANEMVTVQSKKTSIEEVRVDDLEDLKTALSCFESEE